jgi:hypothetical protein
MRAKTPGVRLVLTQRLFCVVLFQRNTNEDMHSRVSGEKRVVQTYDGRGRKANQQPERDGVSHEAVKRALHTRQRLVRFKVRSVYLSSSPSVCSFTHWYADAEVSKHDESDGFGPRARRKPQ